MAFDAGLALLTLGLPTVAAAAVVYAYERPRIAERKQKAGLRAAAKKAQVESAGLRNTIEGLEMRLRDTRAAIAGIDENLRHKLQKMPARDQSALDALVGQGTFADLLTILRKGVLIDRRLDALARSWTRSATERQCTLALCDNLWILEPALASEGHIFLNKPLGVVADAYFGITAPADDLSKAAARKKPSAVGMFRRRSTISKAGDPGDKTLVIIEARRPADTIGEAVVSAAIGYASAIRRLAPELQTWPVECLIVGGAIADDAQLAAAHAPPGARVSLMTWDALAAMARTRRPETVDLTAVRFDADQPPAYNLGQSRRGLGSFLNIDEASDTEDPALRNSDGR